MVYPILYKLATNKKHINQWQIEVKENCYRTISGYVDMVQTTTEWTCCEGKNLGKKNETTPEQQAIAEAEALHRKRIEKGYSVNISQAGSYDKFEPMLAKNWDDEKENVTYPLFSQPKLDGIRCIARKDGLWSRNGKPIVSVPHIYEALKPLFTLYPNLILDGELYADKLSNDFNKICSLVKKTKPTNQDLIESSNTIEYHIYDLPSCKENFYKRSLTLCDLPIVGKCKIVDTFIVHNEQDVIERYEKYIEQGYEGQMLRLDKSYENKRSKTLLKHKSFVDEEFKIVGYLEGEGNRTNMIGKFILQHDKYPDETFDSNIKANWDELKEMWNNKESFLGKMATVKYFSRTPRNEELKKGDVPRFPYIIGIRDYE